MEIDRPFSMKRYQKKKKKKSEIAEKKKRLSWTVDEGPINLY